MVLFPSRQFVLLKLKKTLNEKCGVDININFFSTHKKYIAPACVPSGNF